VFENNIGENSSFLARTGFETHDDGHFRPKHAVKDILSDLIDF
jgi:hypothetical protein